MGAGLYILPPTLSCYGVSPKLNKTIKTKKWRCPVSDTPTPKMNTPRTDEAEDKTRYWYENMREAGDPPFDSAQFDLPRQLERELAEACEQHTMELAAISTAATQNTESSRKQRIDRSNSYCTQAYLDVCRAVDREIELHEQLTAHKAALEKCEMCLEWFDTGRFACGTEAHPGSVESNVPLECHRDAVKEALFEITKLKKSND
jgi:hypothetical protein